MRIHGLALGPVDEGVTGGVKDEPADVGALWPGGVRSDVELGVGLGVAERISDEPVLVGREGAAEGVEVVDALREDGCADGAEELRRGREAGLAGVEEDGGEHVCGAAMAEEVEPLRRGLGLAGVRAGPCGEEVEKEEDVGGVGRVAGGLLGPGEAVVGDGDGEGGEPGEGLRELGVLGLVLAGGCG